MPSQRLSRRENTSVWRSTISGVAMSVKLMRCVGATTVTVPVIRSTVAVDHVAVEDDLVAVGALFLDGERAGDLVAHAHACRRSAGPARRSPCPARAAGAAAAPTPAPRRPRLRPTCVSWRVLCASVWNGSTSPETKASASTSGRVSWCERVMVSPSWISSKVRLVKESIGGRRSRNSRDANAALQHGGRARTAADTVATCPAHPCR